MLYHELPIARERGHSVRGFNFFNMQSTEGAVEGLGLTLCYGAKLLSSVFNTTRA